MEDIVISTPSTNSVIHCGKGAFEKYAKLISGKKLFIVTDSNVFKLYGELIEKTFNSAPVYVIKAGENSKNKTVLFNILNQMLEKGATRATTVVAIGGGVVGDIAGLAAALYMRGVNIVQIPTTLLAQVDSSVGGKTAIDLNGVKNVIGAFYQPSEVIVDPLFLKTLPKREIRCGLGEVIKYGGIDGQIYSSLVNNSVRLFDLDYLEKITPDCIRHKANVVTKDEKDLSGARKTLNLGHTTGHAFELYYKKKSHGEFVLIGAYYELFIAVNLGICEGQFAESYKNIIKKVIKNIPVWADVDKAAAGAKFDKKNDEQSTISMIVPVSEGNCTEVKFPLGEYTKQIVACAKAIGEGKW